MSPTPQLSEYPSKPNDTQMQVREMVLESYHDISSGKGRDCNEFFDDLEKRYSRA